MDHIVLVESKSSEMEALIAGAKKMLIRGVVLQSSIPYGRVKSGDTVYFVNDVDGCTVKAQGVVRNVMNTDHLTEEESRRMLLDHHRMLRLSPEQFQRWSGQPYLVLIEVRKVHPIHAFQIDLNAYGPLQDWMPIENIEAITVPQNTIS